MGARNDFRLLRARTILRPCLPGLTAPRPAIQRAIWSATFSKSRPRAQHATRSSRQIGVRPQHCEANRQIVREAARHGNSGVTGDVEWTGVVQHVERRAHVLLDRAAIGRQRRRNEGYGRQREHIALRQCAVVSSVQQMPHVLCLGVVPAVVTAMHVFAQSSNTRTAWGGRSLGREPKPRPTASSNRVL